MDEQAVSPDHDDNETKAFGISRAMSKDEIAELSIDPLDYQDRHAARGFEVAPSTLALERDDMLCGVGLKTGLLFPSEAGTRPVGNDQLNDVWREAQVTAGIDRPVTVHGIRHSFHDLARQQGVPDAVVKAMAGRAGAEVAQRGQDKHLHYSRGVTVEEMRQASMALMQLVPSGPVAGPKSRGEGRDGSGRGRESDDELAVSTGP
ncbi:MAG TPA: hypothetical protein VF469_17610 [Kofleriaceae bacterium]